MVLAFRWEHEIALIDEILLNLTELMYCSKWKEAIAHCVFILSHLPFEESGKDILFWIYDQKRKLHNICSKKKKMYSINWKHKRCCSFLVQILHNDCFTYSQAETNIIAIIDVKLKPLHSYSQYEKSNIYAIFHIQCNWYIHFITLHYWGLFASLLLYHHLATSSSP